MLLNKCRQAPDIRWHLNCPHPGVTTVTPLNSDARHFLEWMASDGPTPVLGFWKGASLIVLDADEEDYLGTTVAGNGYRGGGLGRRVADRVGRRRDADPLAEAVAGEVE